MQDTRLLILMSPGRQARMYLIGLLDAARRLNLPHAAIELHPLWTHFNTAANKHAAAAEIHAHLADLTAKERFTHVLGYAYNGVELGHVHTEQSNHTPLFASLGLTHLMLWTDHPHWMADGLALHPAMQRLLAHPLHTHFVKSDAAAAEVRYTLGWPRVHPLAMAESYDLLLPAPAQPPTFDAVVISGAAPPLPPALTPYLDADDPDPAAMDLAMLEEATARYASCGVARTASLDAAVLHLLSARITEPDLAYHRLALDAPEPFQASLALLRQSASQWYAVTKALRTLVEWRRGFWLAWLARRARVGVFGCDAGALGVEQTAEQRAWVAYADQPRVYAQGAAALNINAAHDEEGCTHKPFQIAASEAACIHHHTRGLDSLFEIGREVQTFRRGPELLSHVRSAAADPGAAREMGLAMRTRARRDHTWGHRLTRMLELTRA